MRKPQKRTSLACEVCQQPRELGTTQLSYIATGKSPNICKKCAMRIIHSKPVNYNRTITWGSKIRESQLSPEYRKRRARSYKCLGCGKKQEDGYVVHQRYCDKNCQYKARGNDPIKKRVFVMGANLRLGKGKQAFLEKLLREALNKPCPYCGVLLALDNCNVDHKSPYGNSKIRRFAPASVKQHFDKPDNLHIVCKECNAFKGELEDFHFRKFLDFLNANPPIKAYVKKRMARGNLMWTMRRRAGMKRIAWPRRERVTK